MEGWRDVLQRALTKPVLKLAQTVKLIGREPRPEPAEAGGVVIMGTS